MTNILRTIIGLRTQDNRLSFLHLRGGTHSTLQGQWNLPPMIEVDCNVGMWPLGAGSYLSINNILIFILKFEFISFQNYQ